MEKKSKATKQRLQNRWSAPTAPSIPPFHSHSHEKTPFDPAAAHNTAMDSARRWQLCTRGLSPRSAWTCFCEPRKCYAPEGGKGRGRGRRGRPPDRTPRKKQNPTRETTYPWGLQYTAAFPFWNWSHVCVTYMSTTVLSDNVRWPDPQSDKRR